MPPPEPPIEVWRATPAEAPEVTRLFCAFRDWFGDDEPPQAVLLQGVHRLLERDEGEFLLAARPRGPAAEGLCQLRYRWSVWQAGPECALEDLFVVEEARGAGLGAALLEAAVGRARYQGCRRIEVDVGEANAPAHRLYESFGFRSGRPNLGRDVLMRLRL